MKSIAIIISFFVAGLLIGLKCDYVVELCSGNMTRYILYIMMIIVGMNIGSDKGALRALREQDKRIILLPLGTIVGSLFGALVLFPLVSSISLSETLAVASGLGYYSLSSIMLSEYCGAEVGTIALLANVIREIGTILTAPLLVRFLSPFAPIASAGAASIDTLLPIITRFSGKEYVIISIFHGLVMEISVPILVTLFGTM